ncbi:putative protein serine/threonine kinase [Tieghemostelium lacteum]|uniref:Protein kinase domain-containing protein n=1 Tax=Tieghemostelium lacteum TaxID=361077 RepID=A0A152A268_TIELA|nr:putative protein serine/threonine kinase [Tieghemostelium lacteum]|eukprot:KYR00316.1 putative protein serine/threonine kinase [Tieghemostelium lacteum]
MIYRRNSLSNVQINNNNITSPIVNQEVDNNTPKLTPPPNSSIKISRYEEDFCEVEKVGKGGYGSVYKVQNKLDGLYYALKKIPFKNTTQVFLDKVLREVKTLASLNHRNIVRYHSAWLETDNVPYSISRDGNGYLNTGGQDTTNKTGSQMFDGNWGTTNDYDSPPFQIDQIERKLRSPLKTSTNALKKNSKLCKSSSAEDEDEDDDGYDHSLNRLQFPPEFEEEFRQFGKQASLRESMFSNQVLDDSDDESGNTGFGFFKTPKKRTSSSSFSLDSSAENSNNSMFSDDEEEDEEEDDSEGSGSEEESSYESEEEEEEEEEDDEDDSESDKEDDEEEEEEEEEELDSLKKLITSSTTPPISMPNRAIKTSTSSATTTQSLKQSQSSQKSIPNVGGSSTSPPKSLYRLTTLYIVMQLYSQTLGQWLENRPGDQIKEEDNLNIFKQICIGLRYIHSKGIIHRDLKPGNIFLVKAEDFAGSPGYSNLSEESDEFGDLLVSLGDFGLAVQHNVSSTSPTPTQTPNSTPSLTPVNSQMFLPTISPMENNSQNNVILQQQQQQPTSTSFSVSSSLNGLIPPIPSLTTSSSSSSTASILSSSNSSASAMATSATGTSLNRSMEHFKHTSAVGTMTYSSPEQKKGLYNEKTDIYSLGIILFELYYPFSTRMEKARVLSDLRNRILPKSFLQKHPKVADLVLSMMRPNPDERPSAADILKSEIFGQMLSVSEMEYIIKHQQSIIEQLKQQIYQLKSPSQLINQDDVIIF